MSKIKKVKSVEKVLKAYNHSKTAFEEAREDSHKAMRFINNDQWNSEAKSLARKNYKPTLTYNILTGVIAVLVGNEQLNKHRALIRASNTDKISYDMAAIIQGRHNAINDEQNLEEKIQVAFMDGLVSRMGGWIERSIVTNKEGYLDFKYEVANNMQIYVDPEWKVADTQMETCNWIVKEGWETVDYIQHKYHIDNKELNSIKKAGWWTKLTAAVKRFKDTSDYESNSDYNTENDRYKILEMEERIVRDILICSDGQRFLRLTPEEYAKYKKVMPELEVVNEAEDSRIHYTTIIPALTDEEGNMLVVYDEDSHLPTNNFSLFPVHSFRYNVPASEVSSLVHQLIDIQEDINKAKSQARDYVTQMLSTATYISQRETKAIEILKTKGNQPGTVLPLNNPQHKPGKLSPDVIPPEILYNKADSLNFADRISVSNASMRGESERSGESGKLYKQKVERSLATINPYYKNVSLLRKSLAEDFLDNFHFVYSDRNRIIKTKSKPGDTKLDDSILNLQYGDKILNDTEDMSLYIELDEGADNVTTKEENFNQHLALANIIAQNNPGLVDYRALVENAPIQQKEKWLQYIDEVMQQQAAEGSEQKKLDKANQIFENREKELGNLTQEQEYYAKQKELEENNERTREKK